jgi:hypothetical protein
MDILTQYYNHGGQIVSKVPGMDTREFYRDVMFRHRFKEMFCAGSESDGVGFAYSDTGIYLNCGNMPGGLPLSNINDASVVYSMVAGSNGNQAIQPTAISMLPAVSGYKAFALSTGENDTVDLKVKNIRLRAVIKLGASIRNMSLQVYDGATGAGIEGKRETYFQIGINKWDNTRIIQMYAPTTLYRGYASDADLDWYVSNSYTDGFLFDNAFHVYDAFLNVDGAINLQVDGVTVLSGSFPSPWIEGFYSPVLQVLCGFDDGTETYAIESLEVKAI